tara:strand:- start:1734 stop:2132 length:399 start_codon:yes stop_codon:yes gene_type:complete
LNIKNEIISATAMLLAIAKADKKIEKKELLSIHIIISDFYQIESKQEVDEFIQIALDMLNQSTDLFEFGKILNQNWNYQDKVDFVNCMFEVSLADKNLYYLEEHIIKKVATILNINHEDLIKSKIEMKKLFK